METTEVVHADTGILAVTTKHLYFQGRTKGFRVRLDKVVSFTRAITRPLGRRRPWPPT
ncbi:MAG: hypothetical protein H5U01_17505 [Clostridia bacterium]|nr:hypothetical protein [Clostridia bacterium]MBC7347831.1 hypothetical protein [Clostridia bacterium]